MAVVKAGEGREESGEKFGENCARLSTLSSFSSYRGIYEQRSRDVVSKTFVGNRGEIISSSFEILIIKFPYLRIFI